MSEGLTVTPSDADRLEAAVKEFLDHLHDDLPNGPLSTHGDFIADRFLNMRTEREFRRLADVGKAMIDRCLADQQAAITPEL